MSYSYAVTGGVLIALILLIWWLIRRRINVEKNLEHETGARLDAERKVKEHETVQQVESRSLPRGVAGGRVRDGGGKQFGPPPGTPGA